MNSAVKHIIAVVVVVVWDYSCFVVPEDPRRKARSQEEWRKTLIPDSKDVFEIPQRAAISSFRATTDFLY